jgi:hypothetical protein
MVSVEDPYGRNLGFLDRETLLIDIINLQVVLGLMGSSLSVLSFRKKSVVASGLNAKYSF